MPDFLCPNCHNSNRSGAKFCRECGALLLAERYALVKAPSVSKGVAVYEALDSWRCQCGALIVTAENRGCPECGADPCQPLACQIYKYAEPPRPSDIDGAIEMWYYDQHDDVWYGVARPEWQVNWFPYGYGFATGYATHRGQRALLNEDAVLLQIINRLSEGRLRTIGVFAVADGMGGHSAGEIASRTVVDTLFASLCAQLAVGITDDAQWMTHILKQAVVNANTQLFELHQSQQLDLGTTLTAAMVHNGIAVIANIGDSRTYLFRAGRLTALTHDHSLVYKLVQDNKIAPEEIYTHPRRNEVYRCLGDKSSVEVETFEIKLEPADRLLLCCDGLWEMVHDEQIARVLQATPDPQAACDILVERANEAGGEDNISVILVDIQAYTPAG
ncbi:MAG TPA: protein phosphatase 2C domain-containing protein [Anaerolineae bacterium]|nr:protein phosphatase 2C domain-containing protein [Anaerolineae bacterium]